MVVNGRFARRSFWHASRSIRLAQLFNMFEPTKWSPFCNVGDVKSRIDFQERIARTTGLGDVTCHSEIRNERSLPGREIRLSLSRKRGPRHPLFIPSGKEKRVSHPALSQKQARIEGT